MEMELILLDYHLNKSEDSYTLFFQNKSLNFCAQLSYPYVDEHTKHTLSDWKYPKVLNVKFNEEFIVTDITVIKEKILTDFFQGSYFIGYNFDPEISLFRNLEQYYNLLNTQESNEPDYEDLKIELISFFKSKFEGKQLSPLDELKEVITTLKKDFKCDGDCCNKFAKLRDMEMPKLSYKNYYGGCKERTSYIGFLLHLYGIETSKIFIRGYKLRACNKPPKPQGWFIHVANYLKIENVEFVIDLALQTPVNTFEHWKTSIAENGFGSGYPDEKLSSYVYLAIVNWNEDLSDPVCYEFFRRNPKSELLDKNSEIFKEHFESGRCEYSYYIPAHIKKFNCEQENLLTKI